jgi:PAS domain S-box-containing protein
MTGKEQDIKVGSEFRQFFENLPVYAYVVSPDGTLLDVNKSVTDALGYDKKELVGKKFFKIYAPDQLPVVKKKVADWGKAGQQNNKEIVILTKNGERRTVLPSAVAIKDEAGNINYFIYVQVDITEREKIEEERAAHLYFLESIGKVNRAIQQTTDLKSMMSDTLDLVISILNCDRTWLLYPCDPDTLFWSVPMAHNKPEYPGLTPADNIPIAPEAAEVFKTALETTEPIVFDPITKRYIPLGKEFGTQSQIVMSIYPRTGKPWVFGVHQCSHPRIWSEEDVNIFKEIGSRITDALSNILLFNDLKKSEAGLAEAQRIAQLGNWDWDIILNELFWSDEIYRIFGLKPQEFGANYEAFLEKVHPDDREFVRTSVNDALNSRKPYSIEHRIILPDGKEKVVHEQGKTFYEGEKPVRMVGTVQDITERKKIEEERRKDYLNHVGVMMVAISADETVNYINDAGCSMLGYEKEEIIGKNWFENFLPKNISKEVGSVFDELMKGNVDLVKVYENPILRSDGEERVINWNNVLLKDKEGNITGILSTGEDITDKKKAEKEKAILWDQLRQAQKLESIGRLSSGIAHDFNNLLQTTIGFSSLAYERLSDVDPLKDMIDRIHRSGIKASKLIDQLLTFSRRQILNMKVLNMSTAIEEMLDIYSRIIGENVILEADIDPLVKNIFADETQLEQVLMNLLVNARDAMPDGGFLKVACKNVLVDKEFIKKHPALTQGEYVRLTVKDSGSGMSDETRERAFDPFFTTKAEGKGTGLGLSTVFGIVKQHNGYIHVESELDEGTEFNIYFPVTEKVGIAEEAKVEEYVMARGAETILIVEDDPNVRILFVETLEPLGYNIIESESAEGALIINKNFKRDIDLLLTDIILPGIDGFDLFNEIKRQRPEMKTVFVSGYIGSPIVLNNLQNSGVPYLKKPVDPNKLSKKVREVLDEKLQ